MSARELPADVLACPAESYAVTAYVKLTASRWASYMAARYNGPVYLVGSALRLATPRDIDVTVIVADDEFCGRYGYTHYDEFGLRLSQPWIDDLAKRNGELARDFKLNGDFKVYSASHCIQYRDKPRVLLAAPTNLEHIARSTAWWDDPPPSDAGSPQS